MSNWNNFRVTRRRGGCPCSPALLATASLLSLLGGCVVTGEDPPPQPVCGDEVAEGLEQCDDGNTDAGDGCTECRAEPGWYCDENLCSTDCGDGYVVGEEACDPASRLWEGYCSDECEITGACGDGIVQSNVEWCDCGEAGCEGCESNCDNTFGYLCAGSPSVCGMSGLDPHLRISEMTFPEIRQFCRWLVEILGGEDRRHNCAEWVFEVYSIDGCVYEHGSSTCIVGQLEVLVQNASSACSFLESEAPDCWLTD